MNFQREQKNALVGEIVVEYVIRLAIYHINGSLAVVKCLQNQDGGKSNFRVSDFSIHLACLQYRAKIAKNAKRICVAIGFGPTLIRLD